MSGSDGKAFPTDVCPNCCRAKGIDEAKSDLHELVGNLRNKIDILFELYIDLLTNYEHLKYEVEHRYGNLVKVGDNTPSYYPCVGSQAETPFNSGPPLKNEDETIEMLKKEIMENEMKIRFLRGKYDALARKNGREEGDKQ